MLKFVYSFFLGLLLAVFVGYGVATFYPAPKGPEYPDTLQKADSAAKEYNAEQKAVNDQYRRDSESYAAKQKTYYRNVSIIVLACSILLMIIGLTLHSRMTVLNDGFLLGGFFTLLYSIGTSFASESPKYTFAVVTVGLAVTIYMGYRKFVQVPVASPKKR